MSESTKYLTKMQGKDGQEYLIKDINALHALGDIPIDTVPTLNSVNPVTSSGIKSYVDDSGTQIENIINSHLSDKGNPHSVTKSQVGLGNVLNVASYSKTEDDSLLLAKVDKIAGKSLSANDFTNELLTKLSGIADNAEVNINADWSATSGDAQILNKPTTILGYGITDAYTKEETTSALLLKQDKSEKGSADGYASLDSAGKVPAAQLPSYVDDVLEVNSKSALPEIGETGKIYVTLDTNLTYRWGETQYSEISQSLAIGTTSSTAFAGDKGAEVFDRFNSHESNFFNPHCVTKSQVGLSNVLNVASYSKDEADTLLSEKEKSLTAGNNISITEEGVVSSTNPIAYRTVGYTITNIGSSTVSILLDDSETATSIAAGETSVLCQTFTNNVSYMVVVYSDSSKTTKLSKVRKTHTYNMLQNIFIEAKDTDDTLIEVSGLGNSSAFLTCKLGGVVTSYSLSGSTTDGSYTTSFDTIFGENFSFVTDASGNQFVRIPTLYKKIDTVTDSQVTAFSMSFDQIDSNFKPYPCFVAEDGTTILKYVLIGRFRGRVVNSILTSTVGSPTYYASISNYRTYARANTDTKYSYQQTDWSIRQLLIDLFVAVFATTNSDNIFTMRTYGASAGVTVSSGETPLCKIVNGCFSFFGVEDIAGNGYELVDGFNGGSSGNTYICYKPSKYADSITSDYTAVSGSMTTGSGYISKYGYDSSNPFAIFPVSTNASSSTYYCDYSYYNSSSCLCFGGDYSNSYYGLFYFNANYGFTDADAGIGARLCCRSLS